MEKITHVQSRYHDVEMRDQFRRNGYLSYLLTCRLPLQNIRCATGICNELMMTWYLPRKIGSGLHTHPGLPFPHGLSQLGSPGLDAFHNAKSLHDLKLSTSGPVNLKICLRSKI